MIISYNRVMRSSISFMVFKYKLFLQKKIRADFLGNKDRWNSGGASDTPEPILNNYGSTLTKKNVNTALFFIFCFESKSKNTHKVVFCLEYFFVLLQEKVSFYIMSKIQKKCLVFSIYYLLRIEYQEINLLKSQK